jgi:hypothetical protein
MNAEETGRVADWAELATLELASEEFAQIDLDDLLGASPTLAVQAGLQSLQLALSKGRLNRPDLEGMLVVPLPSRESLTLDSPTLAHVLTTPWTYGLGREVPGLYLLRPTNWQRYEACEEYRKHLSGDGALPPRFTAYYRTWRLEEDFAKGWDDYNRAIYIRTA